MLEPPEDAAKETRDPAGVALGQTEAAEQEVKVVPVGLLHRRGRVVACLHGLGDEIGQKAEAAHGCRSCAG